LKDHLSVENVYGCLAGVAIGDAMGMPTSLYTPRQIRSKFGTVRNFLPAPRGHIIHDGMRAGQVTDDTETTLIVARTILEDGKVTARGVAKRLVKWAVERKLLGTDYLGPSTSRALEKLIAGADPEEAGRVGMTDGAASRVSPIGIFDFKNITKVVDDVEKACIPTHNTSVAISAATAVACAVAEGLHEKATVSSVIKAARTGSLIGEKRGLPIPSASVAKRIQIAIKFIDSTKSLQKISRYLYDFIGCGVASNESVPTSLALFAATEGDPMKAIFAGANIGGDTDTIASMVGGISGAYSGIEAFPRNLVRKVEEANNMNLQEIARKLVELVARR
jgi:ADP-ribosylglycohydrolase